HAVVAETFAAFVADDVTDARWPARPVVVGRRAMVLLHYRELPLKGGRRPCTAQSGDQCAASRGRGDAASHAENTRRASHGGKEGLHQVGRAQCSGTHEYLASPKTRRRAA